MSSDRRADEIRISRTLDPAVESDYAHADEPPRTVADFITSFASGALDPTIGPTMDPAVEHLARAEADAPPAIDGPAAEGGVDPAVEAQIEAAHAVRDARPLRERLAEDESVQVVTFRVGGEVNACDILLVEEVVTRRAIHALPDMPPRLLGVLRLRGELVPVLDVAPALGLTLESGAPAVLVVGVEEARVGVAADAVLEVATLPHGAVRPAPMAEAHVAGVARVGERLVNLIDLAEILREQTTLIPGDKR